MKDKAFVYFAVALYLAGCASTPKSDQSTASGTRYDSLYDGQPSAVYATQFPVTSASEAVAKGDQAARTGDLDMALYYYVQALERDDEDAEVFYRVGAIHERRDNHALAAVAYRLAVRQDANHVGANEGLGLQLLRQREYEEARAHLEQAVDRDRKRWRAQNGLGVLADLREDYAAAAGHYKAALAVNPNSPTLLNNLGYSLYLTGDLDGASAAFQRAGAINPGYGYAWRNLGLVYARRGEYDDAVEALSRTLERPAAFNDVGYFAMLNGDYEKAELLLNEATLLSPRYFVKAHENLARIDELRNLDYQPDPVFPPRGGTTIGFDDGAADNPVAALGAGPTVAESVD